MKPVDVTVWAFAIIAATGVSAAETVLKSANAFGAWKNDKPGIHGGQHPERTLGQ